jgi:subtilase family serine protease
MAGFYVEAWAVELPDLTVVSVSAPVSASTGGSITVLTTVKNQGTGSAGNFTVGIYMSTDNLITTNTNALSHVTKSFDFALNCTPEFGQSA